MAKRINAINAYRPRVVHSKTAGEERYMELVTQRTTLSAGVVKNVQESRLETLVGLLLEGQRVRTGGATYYLSIGLDGKFTIKVQPGKRITRAVNQERAFRGRITNAENIGKTSDELVAMWNEAHPDDLVED
jgi:hypothetical protein